MVWQLPDVLEAKRYWPSLLHQSPSPPVPVPCRRLRFSSGVWNEASTFLDFSVTPAYYQTNWFLALCAAGFLALLWRIYRLRVQQLQHQFATGLEARVNERTRIARELHDTLLQSFQA